MSIEVMKQALDALERYSGIDQRACDAEEALLQAIEQAEKQEPAQRPWVGLTDEELAEFSDAKLGSYDLCLEVEAKLKEKNA